MHNRWRGTILHTRRRGCSLLFSTEGIPQRYILTLLGFIGFFNVYAMRVNLSVAMVAMVRTPQHSGAFDADDSAIACPELIMRTDVGNSSVHTQVHGQFDWDSKEQALILGAFFYGYVLTQIPGGIIAEKYGAKWLFGIGVFITSFFTIITPYAAEWGLSYLVAVRIIEGLGEGVTFPAMNAMIGRWAPKLERSRMAAIIYNGSAIGNVVSFAASGIISATIGWPWVFYIFGMLGAVWCMFWMAMVYETPERHPCVTKEELLYIRRGQDERPIRATTIPWRAIFTSGPVWALAITHFGHAWGFYTLLTELPTYLSNILHFNLKKNGTLSAFPYLMQACCAILASFVADKLRSSGRYRINFIRKIFNSAAFFGPALCVFLVGFVGCKPVIIISLFTLAMGFNGLTHSGFSVTHVDMSPELAGTLMGLTNGFANISGFLAPAFVGWVVESGQTLKNWRTVFLTTSAVLIVTGNVYNIFGSAELQSWSASSPQSRRIQNKSDNEATMPIVDNPS